MGGKEPASPKEIAQNTDIIITMVPNAPIVKSLLEGDNGILAGIKENSIVIDMSSVSPVDSKKFAEMVEAKNCKFLDSPVSGGEPGAINATLAFMIGGEAEVVEKARFVFDAMGTSVTLVGPNGSGSVAKLANQIMVNLNIAAVSEALVLATKAGADPQKAEVPVQQVEEHRAYCDGPDSGHIAQAAGYGDIHHAHQGDGDVGQNAWDSELEYPSVHRSTCICPPRPAFRDRMYSVPGILCLLPLPPVPHSPVRGCGCRACSGSCRLPAASRESRWRSPPARCPRGRSP